MTDNVKQALEAIYASLNNNNVDIDTHIAALKKVLAEKGEKSVLVDKTRLAQNDRVGRRIMQSYFKKRGVIVEFAA